MGEIKRPTPEELAAMTSTERRTVLRELTQQSGEDWVKKNCPYSSNPKSDTSFEELIQKLKETFGS